MAKTLQCPSCTSDDLLAVVLTPSGTPMRFATCRHCEHRWWQDQTDGAAIDIGTVIEHIAS